MIPDIESIDLKLNKLKPKLIVWLIPIAYLFHLIEEYYANVGFSKWFSTIFNADLSTSDFIIINVIAFSIVLIIAILYSLNKIDNLIIAVLGLLLFINGIVHAAASLLLITYSPGTITGIFLYIPIGFLIFKVIFPLLEERHKFYSIISAVTLQIIIAVIALNI